MHWRTQVALICAALLIIFFPVRDRSSAELLEEFIWDFPSIRWFGGISSIETVNQGRWYVAATDRSLMFTGPIVRHGDTGRIKVVPPRYAWGVKSSKGTKQLGPLRDLEGLAMTPDGSVYASFEGLHRVAFFENPRGAGEPIRRPAEFHDFPGNAGLESLAIDLNGMIYALPERFAKGNRVPVYRWQKGVWNAEMSIPASAWMRPVSADIGPDGRLYVLERSLTFLGFKSRLRRWRINGDTLDQEKTLIDSPRRTYGNLEGLDVWQDETGALRALIVEDNNFWPFNKTSLLDFRLPN